MGKLTSLLGIKALSAEDPSQPWLPASAMFESLGLGRSDAGVLINEKQALRITTALACIKIISEDLGTTAHEILQRMPDGGMRQAEDHRLWPVIHDQPNDHMTAAVFWSAFAASMLAWGNGYAWIKRDLAARVIALIPLDSARTKPLKLKTGELVYVTTQTATGAPEVLDADDVLHVMYATLDGINGLSPIGLCKNAFGLALAAEKFGANFFGNGARATGIFTYPGQLDEEAQENLKKSIKERMNGENALNPMILEEGMKWQQLTIAPNDAQFLATRQFQDVAIARLYRVAMHLLQDLTRATNNNIEHQSLDHVRYCLRPNAVKIEQEVNRKLLNGNFSMEHNLNDLQRGDFASQASGIQTLRNIGYLSNNDIARRLRENPIPAEEGGDIRIVQGAMIPLTALLRDPSDESGAAVSEPGETDGSQPFDRFMRIYRNLFRDAVGRVLHRGGDAEFVKRAIQPAVKSMAEAMLASRFGSAELSPQDLRLISSVTAMASESAGAWEKKDAAVIATRMTGLVCRALARDLLEPVATFPALPVI